MKRLTYDFCIGGNHCWQINGADNLECREVCQQQEENGCKDCPIAKAFDRLAAIEDILGDEYDLDLVQKLIQAYREGRYIILKEPEQAGISRLRELAEADREGRCMVVPSDYDGEMFKIWKGQILSSRRFVNNVKELGKTVFLTREEARAALRREDTDARENR